MRFQKDRTGGSLAAGLISAGKWPWPRAVGRVRPSNRPRSEGSGREFQIASGFAQGISGLVAMILIGGGPPCQHARILSLAERSEKPDARLTRAAALDAGEPSLIAAAVTALRAADAKLKAVAGSDADGARQTASLLEAALHFHAGHGDTDCPVCGGKPGLNAKWAKQSRAQIDRLKIAASGSDDAHRGAEVARRKAIEMMAAPPKLLAQLFEIGLEGLDTARKQWDAWHAGASIKELEGLANHLESHHDAFFDAIDDLKTAAAAELKRREDRWRPIATAIAGWIDLARQSRAAAEDIPRIKEGRGRRQGHGHLGTPAAAEQHHARQDRTGGHGHQAQSVARRHR